MKVLDSSGVWTSVDANRFDLQDLFVVLYKDSEKVAIFYQPISVVKT